MFVTISHIHPSLVFAGKAGSQLLDFCFIKGFHSGSSSLSCKYYARVEVTDAIAHYGQNVLVYKPKSSSHPHLENNFLPLDKCRVDQMT